MFFCVSARRGARKQLRILGGWWGEREWFKEVRASEGKGEGAA